MTDRQLRWRGGVGAAAVLLAAGLAGQNGTLLLAATVPLAYLALSAASGGVSPAGLAATRTVSPRPARPGELVTVSLTLRNEGDRTVPDVRVADGVPESVAVVEGSPRAAGTLRPGEELTVSYRIPARRGEHAFAPPTVRTRGLLAGATTTARPAVRGDETLVCRLDADAPPLAAEGTGRVGTLSTDDPGRGLAFHSVRDHRPDDPADRIDWRHYAKHGDLTTVNYERSVPATVVLVVDARPSARVAAGHGRPTAVELGAYAATRAITDLLAAGHDAGVAVLGLDGPGPAGLHWLPPASGADQRARALELLRTAADADPPGDGADPQADPAQRDDGSAPWDDASAETDEPPTPRGTDAQDPSGGGDPRDDPTDQVWRLLNLLPGGAQLTLFSPLLDDPPVAAVETWLGAGRPVTVLSADVVPATTVSGQFADVERRTRLARCQAAGASVVDWPRGTPLPLVVEHAFDAAARGSTTRARGGGS